MRRLMKRGDNIFVYCDISPSAADQTSLQSHTRLIRQTWHSPTHFNKISTILVRAAEDIVSTVALQRPKHIDNGKPDEPLTQRLL